MPDADDTPSLYLAWFDAGEEDAPEFDLHAEHVALRDGLYLFRTALTRSKLYHAIKRRLPDDAPLLVAPLADAPKFKGMADGALKWVRPVGADHA